MESPTTATDAAGGQLEVGGVGRGRPVLPTGGHHVVDRGSVARQQGDLHGQTRVGQGQRQPPHGLGIAGEPVQDQRAPGVAGGGIWLSARKNGGSHAWPCYR